MESPCTPYQIRIDALFFKQKCILNLSRRFEFQHGQRRYILQGVIQYWNFPATCKLQHVHSQQSLTDTCIVVMPRFTKSKCVEPLSFFIESILSDFVTSRCL